MAHQNNRNSTYHGLVKELVETEIHEGMSEEVIYGPDFTKWLLKLPDVADGLPCSPIRSYKSAEDRAKIEVPLQTEYKGTLPVISSDLASISSATLRISGLLRRLNLVLGTSFRFSTTPMLRKLLSYMVKQKYDFGMVYAMVRRHWRWMHLYPSFLRTLRAWKRVDIRLRSDSVKKSTAKGITWIDNTTLLPPRRLWDLVSNRIVPLWAIQSPSNRDSIGWVGISHSWMEESRRENICTPINGNEWPVPIPTYTTLERVRVEMLNLGAEYAWLDVLCLRQETRDDSSKEAIRRSEWATDVPTIGNVYATEKPTVYYLSGLGRPFELGDVSSERHWINRAWTLQELTSYRFLGGVTSDSPLDAVEYYQGFLNEIDEPSKEEEDLDLFQMMFLDALLAKSDSENSLFDSLQSMAPRQSTKPSDKIAGLASIVSPDHIPVYRFDITEDEAWIRLLQVIKPMARGELFMRYPWPGRWDYKWCPNWDQAMDEEIRIKWGVITRSVEVMFSELRAGWYAEGFLYNDCHVAGMNVSDRRSVSRGTLTLNRPPNRKIILPIVESWCPPLEDGYYVVFTSEDHDYWVVGSMNESGRFVKQSVFGTAMERVKGVAIDEFDDFKLQAGNPISVYLA